MWAEEFPVKIADVPGIKEIGAHAAGLERMANHVTKLIELLSRCLPFAHQHLVVLSDIEATTNFFTRPDLAGRRLQIDENEELALIKLIGLLGLLILRGSLFKEMPCQGRGFGVAALAVSLDEFGIIVFNRPVKIQMRVDFRGIEHRHGGSSP